MLWDPSIVTNWRCPPEGDVPLKRGGYLALQGMILALGRLGCCLLVYICVCLCLAAVPGAKFQEGGFNGSIVLASASGCCFESEEII